MKGVVFTEFLEMVEEKFGLVVANQIVEASDLPSQGAYSAVGTYDHTEMVQLLGHLSDHSGLEPPQLLKIFGLHLFPKFATGYASLFAHASDAFAFLTSLDAYIHVEVRKLYADAELPKFHISQPDEATLIMEYRSRRGMADLAEGLIEACIQHYQEQIDLQRSDLSPDGTHTRFVLTK